MRNLLVFLAVLGAYPWLAGNVGALDSQSPPNFLVLMADNWAWPHAGCLGDPVVRTPTIDALAKQGVVFDHAFCLAPSCAPARAAFLTGQTIHRLQGAANLWGHFPSSTQVFTHQLEHAGYDVGYSGKGWGPGKWKESGWKTDPSGRKTRGFDEFLAARPNQEQPFFFWFSSRNPHVAWEDGEERKAHMDASQVRVPAYLPDTPIVRDNILDYYAEVELFDEECQEHLSWLESAGESNNTIIVICGDNGWQMPHGLAHVYDAGTRVPLILMDPRSGLRPRVSHEFVNFDDLGPTFLELAGAEALLEATGQSLVPLLNEMQDSKGRTEVFLSRERHANVREADASYPVRAIRTKDFLYVRNLEPDRWPAGDPVAWFAVGPYGDVDYSYTKMQILEGKDQPQFAPFYRMNFAKRPSEELYDLRVDPDQTQNVAAQVKYTETLLSLRNQVARWMRSTGDPRVEDPHTDFWDKQPYYGKLATPYTQRPKRDLPQNK